MFLRFLPAWPAAFPLLLLAACASGPQRPAEPAPAKPTAADTLFHARTEGIIAIQQVDQDSALAYAYSVLPQASSSISDPYRIRFWTLIAWLHLYQYNADSARQCLRRAEPLPEGFASVQPPLYMMHQCARLRLRTIEKQPVQRFDALADSMEAFARSRCASDPAACRAYLRDIRFERQQYYNALGDYAGVIRMIRENLLDERGGSYPGKESDLYNLAYSSLFVHDTAEAVRYFYETWDYTCDTQDPALLDVQARSIHWLGIICQAQGDTLSWNSLTQQAIRIFREIHSSSIIPPLTDMLLYHKDRGDWAAAQPFLAELLRWQAKTQDPGYQAMIASALGNVAAAKGQKEEAVAQLRHALAIEPVIESQIEHRKSLAASLAAAGLFEAAYAEEKRLFEEYQKYFSSEQLREADNLKNQFELRKRDVENAALATEKRLREGQLAQQRRYLLGLLLLLVAALGLLAYSFFLGRTLRAANTRLEAQAVEMRAAKEAAEEAGRAKSKFLSMMSHEIRTPLNAVIGATNLLREHQPRSDQEEYLGMLQFSARHLMALINDVLDFSKIDAGKLELEVQPFDLPALLHDLCRSLRGRAAEKGLALECSYDPALGSWYVGDPVRISQVLVNLIGNAIKFTERGQVQVRIGAAEGGLRFEVEDSGIGIPEERQQAIFEEFTQAESDTTRRFGGSGLGLSISRRLLRLMGSDIGLRSQVGEGSTFFFTLRLSAAAPQAETAQAPAAEARPLEGLRVLLAEDNVINQKIAQRYLQKWGVEATIVSNGAEAVKAFQAQPYPLILMDIHMPEMDGVEAVKQIRSSCLPAGAEVPIIALTAVATSEELAEIRSSGFDDVETKPFDPDSLQQKMILYGRKISSEAISGQASA